MYLFIDIDYDTGSNTRPCSEQVHSLIAASARRVACIDDAARFTRDTIPNFVWHPTEDPFAFEPQQFLKWQPFGGEQKGCGTVPAIAGHNRPAFDQRGELPQLASDYLTLVSCEVMRC